MVCMHCNRTVIGVCSVMYSCWWDWKLINYVPMGTSKFQLNLNQNASFHAIILTQKNNLKMSAIFLSLNVLMHWVCSQIAKFMGPTWGPRWAPCWPHEPYYQCCFFGARKCALILSIEHWINHLHAYNDTLVWPLRWAQRGVTFLPPLWNMHHLTDPLVIEVSENIVTNDWWA